MPCFHDFTLNVGEYISSKMYRLANIYGLYMSSNNRIAVIL